MLVGGTTLRIHVAPSTDCGLAYTAHGPMLGSLRLAKPCQTGFGDQKTPGESTVKRPRYGSHEWSQAHLADVIATWDLARQLGMPDPADLAPGNHAIGNLACQMEMSDAARPSDQRSRR